MEHLPSQTIDLIKLLEELYPDNFPIHELGITSPYEMGKKAGVIELIHLLKQLQEKGEA